MSYKSIAESTKGYKIKWSKGIFPDYRNLSGPEVSQKRINRAKNIVKLILDQERLKIRKAFHTFAKKKFYNQNVNVNVDINCALNMVDNTTLHTNDEALYGESNGIQIWISSIKMSNETLIGTILHESLHNICTINDKYICEKDEHAIMESLGEVLD